MKILLLGSSGLLGKSLYLSISKKFNTYHNGLFKRKRDLNKTKNVELLLKCKPSILINCFGETDIEKCEINKKHCYLKNVKFLKTLFYLKKKNNLNFKVIHFSTDQVYNNKKFSKNCENNKKKNYNYYTQTKILSENIIIKNGGMVLRTNFFGKSKTNKNSFSDWVYKSFKSKKNFFLFDDIFFSPLRISSINKYINLILKKGVKSGIYNLGSKKGMSKYEFATKFAKYTQIFSKKFTISKSKNYLKVNRPNYMIMNCKKFEKIYKIKLPYLIEEIKKESKVYLKNA